jgi:hypothetical protein
MPATFAPLAAVGELAVEPLPPDEQAAMSPRLDNTRIEVRPTRRCLSICANLEVLDRFGGASAR